MDDDKFSAQMTLRLEFALLLAAHLLGLAWGISAVIDWLL
ncbi:hypothetical protein GCM10010989_30580 [Croceicoccus pelagius]|uniref:Uncharacterized protein n=1 Tax=Croceicoccus pelagius TaxID=1703341 RepID=A0A916YPV0_9SPHN|nr:hypothetical protein GCM10010989_30580 [Croceicoccus pelagius]